jgi:3-hydroxyisobutyrate dehydrogenase-like beta-hydroxyacid dehydrogenase
MDISTKPENGKDVARKTVGLVGLGAMGRGLARSLVQAGYTVFAWNRTPLPEEQLRELGVTPAGTPAEAARNGMVISIVADDAALDAVVSGLDGVLSGLPEGGLHLSMSTVSLELAQRLAARHAEVRRHYLATPVFGRPEAAAAARLWIVAAGEAAQYERARPLFEALGQGSFYVGEAPQQANVIKLAGNFLIMSMLESLGEVIALTRKAQLAPQQVLEIINGALFKSPIYESYGRIALEGRFDPPGFRLRLGLKDANLVLAAAQQLQAPMPAASLVRDRLLSGAARGWGEQDWAALTRAVALDAGLDTGLEVSAPGSAL